VRVFRRSVAFLGAIVLILFAVSNRETISLSLWPLPFLVDLPLYLLFFLSLLIGFLVGGCAAWIAGGRDRGELRRRRRRIQALERELAVTQSQLEDRTASMTAPPATRPAS
jgi:lipopolysaccharide assembly protein A